MTTYLGEYSLVSSGGANRSVDIFHGSGTGDLFTKVAFDCPKPIVIEMSEEQVKTELDRVRTILNKIVKSNGLEDFKVHRMGGLMNLDSGFGGCINVNPLFSHTLSDNGLAFVLSHEIAHNICRHFSEQMVAMFQLDKVNIHFNAHDDSVFSGLLKSHEMEADKIGISLAMNAGFDKSGAKEFLLSNDFYNFDKNLYLSYFPYAYCEHPSPEVRVALIDDFIKNNNNFNVDTKYYDDRFNQFRDLALNPDIRVKYNAEKQLAKRILPDLEKEKDYYIESISKSLYLPKEEKIKISHLLKDIQESRTKFAIDDTTLIQHKSAISHGMSDKLSYRAAIITCAKAKEKAFQSVAEKVIASITDKEKKDFYERKVQEIGRKRILGEKVRNITSDLQCKILNAPRKMILGLSDTVNRGISVVNSSIERTEIGKFVPAVEKKLVGKIRYSEKQTFKRFETENSR